MAMRTFLMVEKGQIFYMLAMGILTKYLSPTTFLSDDIPGHDGVDLFAALEVFDARLLIDGFNHGVVQNDRGVLTKKCYESKNLFRSRPWPPGSKTGKLENL